MGSYLPIICVIGLFLSEPQMGEKKEGLQAFTMKLTL